MRYNGHLLRHELKYYIAENEVILLRELLHSFMKKDENMQSDQGYLVSSIYFDDMNNSAMQEKVAGIAYRKKYRVRCYDLNDCKIRLECKEKFNKYISKRTVLISREEYNQILMGNIDVLASRKEELCKEFLLYSKTKLLHPVVVVEYLREAYVLPAGNVRITFDKEISASFSTMDVFAEEYLTGRIIEEGKVVLEIKYDDFIPGYIKQIINIINAEQSAISKYVMCREYKRKVKHI